MLSRRKTRRSSTAALVDGLNAIVDSLRSGASLRLAVISAAGMPGSPLGPVASALAAGRPLVGALREAAVRSGRGHPAASGGGDADLSSAFCVLSVHAEAGGDPLPACRALAERLARREAAREEARALTTQARLGARAILLLTPIFLLLVGAADPHGALRWVTDPRTRLAVVAGLVLQGLGALWIGAIVRGVGGGASRVASMKFLRAVHALLAGRVRPTTDGDVAETAELLAFVLDAGLAPSAAVVAIAPFAPGPFGARLREIVESGPVRPGTLGGSLAGSGDAADRFARAIASSSGLGVPLAPALRALAVDLRRRESVQLSEDVRRSSVRVLMPLGVVILPAFVLACLVPLFVGGLEGIAG